MNSADIDAMKSAGVIQRISIVWVQSYEMADCIGRATQPKCLSALSGTKLDLTLKMSAKL